MVDFSKLFETDEEAALKNYAARLPVTNVAIDPQTGFEYNREIVPELKLPVQGAHTYHHGWAAQDEANRNPIEWFPPITGGYEGAKRLITNDVNWPSFVEKITGSNGIPREQLWPEKMVRSGLSLAGDVMSGRVATGVGLRRGDYSDDPNARQPLSDLIERTQDMAGLAAGGSITGAGLKAEGPGVISRGAKALKDRLNEVFAEENHNLRSDVIGGTAEVRKSSDSKGWEIWNKDKNELWVKQEDGMSKFEAQKQAENLNKQSSDMAIRLNADNQVGTVISGANFNKYIPKKAANINTSQSEIKAMLAEPTSFPERLYTNYVKAIKPEDVLSSEPVWGGAERLSNETGIGYSEAFAQIANEFWKRQGANRYITPELAQAYIKRERAKGAGIQLLSDNEAGTVLAGARKSLANRLQETMPEILNKQRASEGYEAAIRDPETKKLYTGMWHEEVMDKMAKDKGIPRDQLPDNIVKGYIDHNGRFLTEAQLEKRSQSKSAMFRSDDIVGTALAGAEATAPRFYSHVENLINNATTMVRNAEGKRVEVPQTKFNANEVLPYLKNKGATAEEIEALKLPEFLEGKKSITKDELAKHIDENKVGLKETVLGGSQRKSLKEWSEEHPNSKNNYEDWMKYLKEDTSNPPRFAQYQLPGGSNYKELLMSLKDNPKVSKRVEEINKEISNIEQNYKNDRINFKNEMINKHGKTAIWSDEEHLQYQNIDDKYKERKYALAQERLDLEQSFTHEHWPNNKNVVVHARMNDRDIPGFGKTLHAEEIQSDWLQKGNSEGFKLPAKEKAKLEPEFNKIDQKILKHAEDTKDESIVANPDIKDAIKTAIEKKVITKAEGDLYLRYSASENYGAVLDAPFKSQWSDLMIKRLIRQAAEENRDAISWTPGQAQIDRYPGLQQHFDKVEYNPKTQEFKAYGKDGNVTKKVLAPKELVDYIGKEATDKLINSPTKKTEIVEKKTKGQSETDKAMRAIEEAIQGKPVPLKEGDKSYLHTLENADLKVGGEFHKKFYDEILVNKVNAIAKKFGGRVEEKEINDNHHGWHKIWVLRLTPEMKKHALEKGFSMFEIGLPLPTNTEDKKYKLIPVSHNPFLSNRLM